MLAAYLYQMGMSSLPRLFHDRRAVTSIEYGVIALVIVLAIVGSLVRIGGDVAVPFGTVASEL